ncbi:DUF4177 domain-containing protein [Aliiroseovarius crassostreae]|uniref:DUF4177 domain-containing protein n=1 Tax=Aliiroseovarius crassostreae TaxID=154981 RepID=UPI002205F81B|nr:DUF4177 domain-containing protein [Aliiroseovarius crassostreae]UWP99561.1 DUF4177 domain-containing protein [Aliiroseovarius crassostreae]UWQ09028.1 DUF4177 domain-containing protein [Aliiroseovarius crassostreae]UWQ12107.1 DUF4177 domain-containing protein [Aliiroseovarius crassostreae]
MQMLAKFGHMMSGRLFGGWSEPRQNATSHEPKHSETGSMYEYRVIPAPSRGKKAKGVKTSEDRFALAMSDLLNEMAAAGWDYQRAETLPAEERKGLTGKTSTFRNLLVFRRERAWDDVKDTSPTVAAPPVEETNAPALPSAAKANEVPADAPALSRDGDSA